MRRRLEEGHPTPEEWAEEQRGHLDRLELLNSQTTRLGRLIDELLDVSRIESGKLDFHLAPVDLGILITEVARRLQLTTSDHTIEVDLNGSVGDEVSADRDHLEQVLDNLLSNAIKFSPDGGTIRVSLREIDDGSNVVMSVQDPGIGIPPAKLEEIFGLFYQAEDPVSRRTGGMGLGLYICREIVSRHGGKIWADSHPSRGTTFSVSLPRAVPVSVAAPRPKAKRRRPAPE
jgi:signal transduction histidine kinase